MLEVKNINTSVGSKKILKNINLNVQKGEIHVLLGPNGAGKSTLGHAILGNPIFQTSGDVFFEGVSIKDLNPDERARKGFFLSFQSPPELDGISGKEFLFGAKKSITPSFHSSFRFQKKLTKDLQDLHLSEDFKTREMNKSASGGEKKKMEIVSLLTLDPKVAFLDEIDSGVDVDALNAISLALKKFMEKKEKAIILVSHTEKLLQKLKPTHVHILINGAIKKTGDKKLIQEVHKKGFKHF